jgi:hypothetical protein
MDWEQLPCQLKSFELVPPDLLVDSDCEKIIDANFNSFVLMPSSFLFELFEQIKLYLIQAN